MKYADETCEKLWDITMNGMHDSECGDVDGPSGEWFGLVTDSGISGAEHAIVSQSSFGFVDYEVFPTAKAAQEAFDNIETEIAEADDDD